MRKYYSKQGPANAAPRSLMCKIAHWDLLAAFVSGCGELLDESIKLEVLDICARQSVKDYLELSSRLDSYSQSYSVNTNPETVFIHRQIGSFLKKFPFTKEESGMSPRDVAIEKWRSSEESCSKTNLRLKELTRKGELPRFIYIAKELIRSCLGDLTNSVILGMVNGGKHGPGATLTSTGNKVTEYYKYFETPYSSTKSALWYAYSAISANPRWMQILEGKGRQVLPPVTAPCFQKELMLLNEHVELVESDKITFVPKDARTDRPIAVGASLNVFLQLGVNSYITRCLKRVGVDLKDQAKNQKLAREGSAYAFFDGCENPSQFSTIDLSSASDTISIELVKLLLDPMWYAYLDDLRHKSGTLDGELIVYNKFAAMGNGYTFPLESLIFWAVTKATALEIGMYSEADNIAIYGDDIIVRNPITSSLITNLSFCGFTVNEEKSFLLGAFKESCGADYFNGINARPFYLKRRIQSEEDAYFVCNSIADICKHRSYLGGLCSLYSAIIHLIPARNRIYTPVDNDTDSGLNVPLSYVSGLGLRPWLKTSEIFHLFKRGLLRKEDIHVQSPYAWIVTYSARSYKGLSSVRLLLALTGKIRDPKFYKSFDLLSYEAARSGVVTRRNSVQRNIRVQPIPNWDGKCTYQELKRHPIYFL